MIYLLTFVNLYLTKVVKVEFYKSIRFGHLYIIKEQDVYVVIDGLPFLSGLSVQQIKDEGIYFTKVAPQPIEGA